MMSFMYGVLICGIFLGLMIFFMSMNSVLKLFIAFEIMMLMLMFIMISVLGKFEGVLLLLVLCVAASEAAISLSILVSMMRASKCFSYLKIF